MLMKTHLAVGIFFMFLFLPYVVNKWVFILIILIASIIPDIDSAFSTVGKNKLLRFVQWLTKHRGVFHSFTFCLIISIILAIFYPPSVFPFFLGYSIHLLCDSFTITGIRPFWPSNLSLNGKIKTGGKMEFTIYVIFVILNVVMVISLFL